MDLSRNLIILSAELERTSDEANELRTQLLRNMLEDLNLDFIPAMGYYNNVAEESFVVFLPEVNGQDYAEYDAVIDAVQDFAFKNFDQEAVLYQEDGEAWLIVDDNGTRSSQHIGKLVEVNPKMTEVLEAFTIVNNRVFTTKK